MAVIKLSRKILTKGKANINKNLIEAKQKLESTTDYSEREKINNDINFYNHVLKSDSDKLEDWSEIFEMGYKAEEIFKKLCIRLGYGYKKSSLASDMKRHIDCYIVRKNEEEVSVDVKAIKRLERRDASGDYADVNDKIQWLEFNNTYGGKGWLFGKANIIAFQFKKGFYLVNRESLVEWANELYKNAETFVYPSNKFYKKYSRKSSPKECSMLIKVDEMLKNTKHSIWYFPNS